MNKVLGTDDGLSDELRSIAERMDPPPATLREAARSAYTWRTVDEELAELVFDSARGEDAGIGVRADAGPRLLTFECGELELEVEVTALPGGRRLVGQVVPPQAARIVVRHGGGTVHADADALGRFTAAGISPGPVSLRCVLGAGEGTRAVATDWLPL